MKAVKDREDGLKLWATEGASSEEVVEKLVQADRAAFMWHVANKLLSGEQIAHIESVADKLLSEGYHEDEHA